MQKMQPVKIGLFSLILLICVSIDSVRNLPSTALFGPTLIFLYLISSLFLLIPGSIASAEFAYHWPERGGIFQWVSLGLGKKIGFFAVWGQWINTLIWFPTILSFVAGSIAYLIKPEWETNSHYVISVTLICFWLLTLLSVFGFRISGRVASFCSFFGLILPMGFIIGMAILWMIKGYPMQVAFTHKTLLPDFHSLNDWCSLVAIMTSFAGFELVAVHMLDIKNPKKNYPRAMLISVGIILFTMVFGSLAIAIIIPKDSITLVSGVAQGFGAFLAAYHMNHLLPVLVVLMTLGNLGEMINWLSAPACGLQQAAEAGFLPKILQKKNRFNTEQNLLIFQAILISLVSLVFLLIPTINGAYWFLTNLSVEIYMVVYLLLFIAAIRVEFKFPNREILFSWFRNRSVYLVIYAIGALGCIITLIIGAYPPTTINIGSPTKYQFYFWIGMIICVLPIIPLYFYRAKQHE